MLQTQLSVVQLQFWFDAQGRTSFWQELSDDLKSWPPKQLVPAPDVGQAQAPCVLSYAHVWAEAGLDKMKKANGTATAAPCAALRILLNIGLKPENNDINITPP